MRTLVTLILFLNLRTSFNENIKVVHSLSLLWFNAHTYVMIMWNKTNFCEKYANNLSFSFFLSFYFLFITEQFYLRITRCLVISFRLLPCRCSFSVRIPMDEAVSPSPCCYHWIEHLHVRVILWKFIKNYPFFIRSSNNSIFFKIRFRTHNTTTLIILRT